MALHAAVLWLRPGWEAPERPPNWTQPPGSADVVVQAARASTHDEAT